MCFKNPNKICLENIVTGESGMGILGDMGLFPSISFFFESSKSKEVTTKKAGGTTDSCSGL